MSEEVQNTEETAAEASSEAVQASAPAKKKKINKLTQKELLARIADCEEKKNTHSTYYKQLLARKQELGIEA